MVKIVNALLFELFFLCSIMAHGTSEKPICTVDSYAMLKNGQQEPVAKVIVEEFLTTKFFTLLNYVFYDEGSAVIPSRYHLFTKPEEAENFNPEIQFINFEILDVYYDIINIIGFRLRTDKKSNITLQGCNSNTGIEAGNLDLSKKRAESIKNYLVLIWKIDTDRIIIAESKNLPNQASNSKVEPLLSNEENRRVEILGGIFYNL